MSELSAICSCQLETLEMNANESFQNSFPGLTLTSNSMFQGKLFQLHELKKNDSYSCLGKHLGRTINSVIRVL